MIDGSASLSVLLSQPYNPGPTAQLYSSLAAVLAGFAFAGLVMFLSSTSTRGDASSLIPPGPIVTTLFCAMSSLTICAFLYGRAAGESEPSGRNFLMLSLYGMVLAPAVLSLFYALNLIMASREATKNAAIDTRWVVAAVGPAVVMSLLADLLANGWAYGCDRGCTVWSSPRLWGFVLAAFFLVFGLMTSLLARSLPDASKPEPGAAVPDPGLVESIVCGILGFGPIKACAAFFRRRRSSPAFITLILTASVAMFSLWARGTPDGFGTRTWTHAVLGLAALVMAVFAFAAASVLDKPIFLRAEILKQLRENTRQPTPEPPGRPARGPDDAEVATEQTGG